MPRTDEADDLKSKPCWPASTAGPLRKAMEILAALGAIYGAERMVPVTSVQIAGVSYDNLGEAGLEFLHEMADGGGKARVLTTLNPAGMDVENWQALGIPAGLCRQPAAGDRSLRPHGRAVTCTCTPYLAGNMPRFGEHIAWAESSAVCYANSVLGARTNREGGPSALAAALTGRTPAYGCTWTRTGQPTVTRRGGSRCARHARLWGAGQGDWRDVWKLARCGPCRTSAASRRPRWKS